MVRSARSHHPNDFALDIAHDELDLFRWFLLVYLLGKPIQSPVAVQTWRLLVEHQLDTPWALLTALRLCAQQLIDQYDGSLMLLIETSPSEAECAKRLQKFYGVGPKTAEIFLRGVAELFAQRVE